MTDPRDPHADAALAGLDETANPYDLNEDETSFWAWQDGWNSIMESDDEH
ncbi:MULTISPECIES: hypothetical protein [unclassified Xanthobacter]|nr:MULTISPECIES: hypothetical protein [unclassified Xanthobacter]